MKKVLFTALAVVLFSGVSMANTKEIKVEKKLVKVELKKKKKSDYPCCDAYSAQYAQLTALGASSTEATTIATRNFNTCLQITYGVN